MTLKDACHQLANEHMKMGPDGRAHKVPALLDELRRAVTPGNSGSGCGGASGPPIPINPEAVDMLTSMEAEGKEDYRIMTGERWTGNLVDLLRHLPTLDLTPDWDKYLTRATTDWINTITAFLWPVKPRRKLTGATCPSCGFAYYGEERKVALSLGCWDDAGELAHPGRWDIECAGCEAGWTGDRVTYLLRALNTTKDEDAA